MTTHGSATVREETPHATRTTRADAIINVLKQRALSVLHDPSADPNNRAILRYALNPDSSLIEQPETHLAALKRNNAQVNSFLIRRDRMHDPANCYLNSAKC